MQFSKYYGVVLALALGVLNLVTLYKYQEEWVAISEEFFGGEKKDDGRSEKEQYYFAALDTQNNDTDSGLELISTSQQDDGISNNDSEEKVFILHVGPHKTGSTSLQEFIFRNNLMKDALKKDNYRVPLFHFGEFGFEHDPKNHAVFAHCLLDERQNNFCPPDIRTKVLGEFQSFINDSARDGANIIMTSEGFVFESLDTTELTSYILPDYKIHVVVFYRRFYDWARSTYNQRSKAPLENGEVFLQFPTWLQKKLKPMKSKYSAAVRHRFQKTPGISVVRVENLHKKDSKLSSAQKFFCTHVDNAFHTCNLAKSEVMEHENESESLDDLDLKRLHNHILSHELIDISPEDTTRWKKIDDKFHSSTDLPRICLDEEFKKTLLDLSVEYEIALTPESWHNSPEGLDSLKSDFDEKMSSEFCAVDVVALVESPEWQWFLMSV